MIDWFFENMLGPLLAVAFIGILVVLGWAIYDGATAETFALRRDSWHCTQTHGELIGKIYQDVCDNWRSNYIGVAR